MPFSHRRFRWSDARRDTVEKEWGSAFCVGETANNLEDILEKMKSVELQFRLGPGCRVFLRRFEGNGETANSRVYGAIIAEWFTRAAGECRIMRIFRNIHDLVSVEELLFWNLEDLYDAEHRIVESLPELIDATDLPPLLDALGRLQREASRRIAQLEDIFHQNGKNPEHFPCNAVKELIAECEDVIDSDGDPDVKDAALIDAVQRLNHYMAASYAAAEVHARRLGYHQASQTLRAMMNEEKCVIQELEHLAEQPQMA